MLVLVLVLVPASVRESVPVLVQALVPALVQESVLVPVQESVPVRRGRGILESV